MSSLVSQDGINLSSIQSLLFMYPYKNNLETLEFFAGKKSCTLQN